MCAFVSCAIRVHRIPPNVRDDGQRPLFGRDGRTSRIDLPDALSEIFFQEGLDTPGKSGGDIVALDRTRRCPSHWKFLGSHGIGRKMIRRAALRRLSTLLIGLFFAAQVCGVVPLLGEHAAHVTESQLILATGTVAGNASHGHHHDGDADGAIQHHELQDLNGAPACLIAGCELAVEHVATTAYVSEALTESNPVLLERPPKPRLSA